jgi:hypothetical protein
MLAGAQTQAFDMSAVRTATLRGNRFTQAGLIVMIIIFGTLGGLYISSPPANWPGSPLIGQLIGAGMWVAVTLCGVTFLFSTIQLVAIEITPEAVVFYPRPGVARRMNWNDPRAGFRLLVTPEQATKAMRTPPVTPFGVATGLGTSHWHGWLVSGDVTRECFEALLSAALAHGLSVDRKLQPDPKTSGVYQIFEVGGKQTPRPAPT